MASTMTVWGEILKKYTNWLVKSVLFATLSLDIQGVTA